MVGRIPLWVGMLCEPSCGRWPREGGVSPTEFVPLIRSPLHAVVAQEASDIFTETRTRATRAWRLDEITAQRAPRTLQAALDVEKGKLEKKLSGFFENQTEIQLETAFSPGNREI